MAQKKSRPTWDGQNKNDPNGPLVFLTSIFLLDQKKFILSRGYLAFF